MKQSDSTLRRSSLLGFGLLLLCTGAFAQLEPFGIETSTVTAITAERGDYPNGAVMSNMILAGTVSEGVFSAYPYWEKPNWLPFGLPGRKINALTVQHWGVGPRDGLHLLAGVEALTGAVRAEIFRRPVPILFPEDSVWESADSGIDKQRIGSINALAAYYYTGHEPPQPVLAGFSYGVYHGTPAGYFWTESLFDDPVNINAIDVAPAWFGDLAWAAGQKGVSPAAFHSFDKGITWTSHMIPSMIEGEVYSVAINPRSRDSVYVGGLGVLYVTPDSGKSWIISLQAPQCRFTAIAVDPVNPSLLFAGGLSFSDESFFFRSLNGGKSWERIYSAISRLQFLGVTSMAIVSDDSILNLEKRNISVYIGTNGSGVWRYRPMPPNGVEADLNIPSGMTVHQNYPNPARDETTLSLELSRPTNVEIVMHDLLGRVVRRVTDDVLAAGIHTVPVSVQGLPAGMYYFRITAGREMKRMRMQVIR